MLTAWSTYPMTTSLIMWFLLVIAGIVAAWIATERSGRRSGRPHIANRLTQSIPGRGDQKTAKPVQLELEIGDSLNEMQWTHEKDKYFAYMNSSTWREKRSAAIQRAGGRCQICGLSNRRLQVHHNSYERLGFESPEDLIVVCDRCHRMVHGRMRI